MTCMNIPVSSAGQACTMDVECGNINGFAVGNINGFSIGECRNMMCGFLPAVLEGEMCTYGYDCGEGLDCFSGTCLPKDVPLSGACTVME